MIKTTINLCSDCLTNIKVGEFDHHPKMVKINGLRWYVSGIKTLGKNGKIDFLILIYFYKPEQSLEYYKKRWQIESLLKPLSVAVLTLKALMLPTKSGWKNFS